jgi:hypothetical protein
VIMHPWLCAAVSAGPAANIAPVIMHEWL